MVLALCRVYKPRVPQGPALTSGPSPRKQHVVHGPAQESKTQRAGRIVRLPTGRSTQKNKRPLFSFFGPPLRPEHSLRTPAAFRRSLRSEGLAQNAASYSDPASPTRDPVGSLLTALLRLARPGPTGAIRPGTLAQKGPGANGEGSTLSQTTILGPYPVRLQK